MIVTTVTVNQWVIKSNAENSENEPVLCVNHYAWNGSEFGEKIGETEHHHDYPIPLNAFHVRVVHDPINKTPCQASCWMQFVRKRPKPSESFSVYA